MTQTTDRPPARQGTPPDDDLWGGFNGEEPAAATSAGGGRRWQRPTLPPVRPLADRKRKPSGRPSHPLILVSGGDHSGKSYELARLSGDPRLGPAYWFEIGETTAEWYGQVPGADYDIIGHDGTWRDFLAAVEQSHAEAHAYVASPDYDGRPPAAMVDSMTGEWTLLSQWAENRALDSTKNQEKLAKDPNADIDIGTLYWNAANRRHRRLMTLLLTWPGPVLVTARSKMAVAIGPNGQPDTRAEKVYTVEAQRSLPFDSLMHVQLDAAAPPLVRGYRHPTHGIGGKYGGQMVSIDPKRDKRFRHVDLDAGVLPYLLFDVIRYNPAEAVVTPLSEPVADAEPDDDTPPPAIRRAPAPVDADEAPGQPTPEGTTPRQDTR